MIAWTVVLSNGQRVPVTVGEGTFISTLQRRLGVEADGVLGPATLAALRAAVQNYGFGTPQWREEFNRAVERILRSARGTLVGREILQAATSVVNRDVPLPQGSSISGIEGLTGDARWMTASGENSPISVYRSGGFWLLVVLGTATGIYLYSRGAR